MQPKLEDIPDPATVLGLELGQSVQIPGIKRQRLFAYRLRLDAKREADMGIVQVVGGADTHIINRLLLAAQLFRMPVKALEFGKKGCLGKIPVDNTDRVVRICCCDQFIPCLQNGFHMLRGDIAGSAY